MLTFARFFRSCTLVSLSLASSYASADTLWNESVQGDLSSNRLAPSAFSPGVGTHSLFATTGSGDLDYITLNLAPGTQLTQLTLVSYTGADRRAFIGVQPGATFTEDPNTVNVANLLGWSHFGPGAGNVGLDILPSIGAGAGAIGFTPPLASGTYTFWLQQLGASVNYQMDFVVVPAPGILSALPVAALIAVRRRR
jgi:hypothetical protein